MKRKYDLVFGIGATCSCSQTLRAAGLQYASFPYDWMGGSEFRFRADYLCDGFPGLFDRETFHLIDIKGVDHRCWASRNDLIWPHDLRPGLPLEAQLPAVEAKYVRRVDRLFRLLDTAHRTLVVYIDNRMFPSPSDDDVRYFRDRLVRRWPDAGIEMLYVRNAPGVRPKDARVIDGPDFRVIEADCCTYVGERGADNFNEEMGRFLAGLYEVVDYRTPEERREGPRKRRLAKYGKLAAKTFWGYVWNKMQLKLYKHLLKRMQRKGLA